MKQVALVLSLLFVPSAHAYLRTSEIVAGQIVSRPDGLCAVPLHLSGAKYAKKDAEHETFLCGLERGTNVAYCPKYKSTNPAVELYTPPANVSVRDLERRECLVKGAEKQAKYKQSITCSYAPGILAYYHVSRALGNVANVPTAVLRTLDLNDHREIADRALHLLRNRTEYPIYASWTTLSELLSSGQPAEGASRVLTSDQAYTWGALVRNPRGESEYPEFNGVYGNPDRLGDFRHGPIYSALSAPALAVGRDFSGANAQALRQLKDAADFILLDTLLSQQDRFGNFHQKPRAYFLGANGLEKADKLDEVPAEFRAKAAMVKEMLLRDNDCGVGMAFTNRLKNAHLLEGVAHMDPETYRSFQAFAAGIAAPETATFFVKGLQLRDSDFQRLRKNVQEASQLLRERCKSGALSLDLDLQAHFSGQALAPSVCE